MIIALDYDGTYTADPRLWDQFIYMAKTRGHEVHIVTARSAEEPVHVKDATAVHYTYRHAKRTFMYALGLHVAIWIDDMPDFILHDAAPYSLEDNNKADLWFSDHSDT